ncbi:C-C motif chemokine 25 [Orycteropus afer afer]|uniref:C-C motif chemokine 25 n=1 Tax=Orycteropus afer afer TaxID=1230840 RepID=A0A8B7AWC5_ORYAF|nr:C-C motif chemokine 25 [Orycteropus afer afer]
MNLWLLACLVACFVGAWVPAVRTQGAFEDCCLAYHHITKTAMLRHAKGYRRQEVSGSCNLPAVIFFLPWRHRVVCGNPQVRWVQNAMKFLDSRSKNPSKLHDGTRKPLRGSRSEVKKLGPGTSRVLVSTFGDPSGSSKRHASFLRAATQGP